MPQRRDVTAVGIGGGLVAGAALIFYSVGGLSYRADQADRWRAQALSPRPTATVTAAPSTNTAPAAAPSGGLPGFRAQPVTAHSAASSGAAPAPVTSRPSAATPRPTPSPAPAPTAHACAAGALAVTLPLTILRCNAITIGGSS